MKRFRPVKRWYGFYNTDAYALGPIEAKSKTEAKQIFKQMFGRYPNQIWLA